MAIMSYTEHVFSPLDYTPIAWYDSSDVSTITKDISDKVSEWRDKSGLGYHLTQSVDISKPDYSAVNGIVFDGNNDILRVDFGVIYNQPNTVLVVWEVTGDALFGNTEIVYDGYNKIGYRELLGYRPEATVAVFAGTLQSYAKVRPFKIISTSIYNSTSSFVYENNIAKLSNVNVGTQPLSGFDVGNYFRIGDPSSLQYGLVGNIKELICYNYTLTTEQITTVNNYLNTKYNVY